MKMMTIRYIIGVSIMFCYSQVASQNVTLNVSYGLDVPGLDMADRYGLNYDAAIDIDYVRENGWFFGAHGHMLLGPFVKEDVIGNIRTSTGTLIGQQKNTSLITLKQRGFLLGIHGGKFFNLSKQKYQHGIRTRIGSSLLTHYIVFNDESATVNQLLGDYGKGYDRFTRGLTTEQFIGYQYINQAKTMDVYAGFQFIQGYTRNRRPIDFDTRSTNHSWRLDLLTGFRIGIAIKLYQGGEGQEVYY